MKINKEGYKIIGTTGLICLAIWLMAYLLVDTPTGFMLFFAFFLVIFWFFVAAFFREPRRVQIHDDELIFSPCDGRVVVTEVVHEKEHIDCEMMQISIFMSVTNVHMNWFPVGGEVEYTKHHHGRFLVAWHPKSSTENERATTVIKLKDGRRVLMRQIAGFVARRIVTYAKPGKRVKQNDRLGFIKFGSRVDILIPKDSELYVEIGDPVIGSQTPIARLKRKSNA
jgi:phosphatidylserine decarboxylase